MTAAVDTHAWRRIVVLRMVRRHSGTGRTIQPRCHRGGGPASRAHRPFVERDARGVPRGVHRDNRDTRGRNNPRAAWGLGHAARRGRARAARSVRHSAPWSIAVLASTAGLALVFLASVHAERALAGMDRTGALHITLTGHQYWWEAQYDDPAPAQVFITANELHVPVGRPVIFTLLSDDVIHSFWVPNLHGKKDLIPGHTRHVRLARRSAWHLSRAMCGVLRLSACTYGAARGGGVAGRIRSLGAAAASARRASLQPRRKARPRRLSRARPARCATRLAARRRAPARRRTSRTSRAAVRWRRGPCPTSRKTSPAGLMIRNVTSPGVNMPPHALPPQDLPSARGWLGTLQ